MQYKYDSYCRMQIQNLVGVAVEGVEIGFCPEHKGKNKVNTFKDPHQNQTVPQSTIEPQDIHPVELQAHRVLERLQELKDGVEGAEDNSPGIAEVGHSHDE